MKLSQLQLAEKSGVSLGSIKRFEQTGKISFESLLTLAHILGRLSEFESIFLIGNDLVEVEKLFSDKTRK
ncbi:MAG: helix-turn-helix transcriptional regulator [Lewinellaceae bacterium]|nr:helix-turn-helix transcriptional regulator [Lewinellaceae bacterium]